MSGTLGTTDPAQDDFRRACGELDRQLRAGEPTSAQAWVEGAGPLADHPELAVELIFTEYVIRDELGLAPSPEDFCSRYPSFAERLRRLFDVDQLMRDTAAPAAGQDTPPIAKAPAGPPPECVGGYELRGRIGHGGMGIVYRAWDSALRRDVAIKQLRAGIAATPLELKRLRKEATASARLNHPNVVQIYEIGEDDGQPYLVLEYVPGIDLREYLAEHPMPAATTADLIETVARAVHHAHQNGVVHRDLKPANVLLSGNRKADNGASGPPPAVGRLYPKVTDFGLAATLGPGATATAINQIVGTAGYMAPEQAQGLPNWIAPAVDIYALGAVLYECLTGRVPFLADTPLETLRLVTTADPVPPGQLVPSLPRDLETICLKCLYKNPARRYSTAEALADDLRRFRERKPIAARRVSPTEKLVKWARRRPTTAASSLVAGLALVALAVSGVVFTLNLRTERDATDAQRREADCRRIEADYERGLAAAERARAEAMLARTRELLYARQVSRAAGIAAREPKKAAGWLDDPSACPSDLREFAWNFVRARSQPLDSTTERHRGGVNALAATADGTLAVTAGTDGLVVGWDGKTGTERFHLDNPHGGPVTAVAISADGKILVTAGADAMVRVWDATTRKAIGEPVRLPSPILAVAISADGKTIAAGGTPESGTMRVRVWETESGTIRANLDRPTGQVRGLCFSPDGRTLAAGYAAPKLRGEAVLWNVATGTARHIFPFPRGLVPAVAFSPDGTRFAAGTIRPTENSVLVWAVADGRPLYKLEGNSGVWAVRFSPDGESLAVAQLSGEIAVWDLSRGTRQTTLHGHAPAPEVEAAAARRSKFVKGSVRMIYHDQLQAGNSDRAATGVAFADGGRRLISAGVDRTVRTWNLDPTPFARTLNPDDYTPTCIAPTTDGSAIYLGGDDRTIRRWEPRTGQVKVLIRDLIGPVRDLAISPDGKTIALVAASDQKPFSGEIRIWNPDRAAVVASTPITGRPGRLMFTPDGSRVAVALPERLVILPLDASRVAEYPTGEKLVPLLAAGRSGSELLLASGRKVQVLDAANGRVVTNWPELPSTVVRLATVPGIDMAMVAFHTRTDRLNGRQTYTIESRRPGSGALIDRFTDESSLVASLCLAPHGRTLVSSGSDMPLYLWHAPTAQELTAIDESVELVSDTRFTPDGNGLAALVVDAKTRRKRVTIWNPAWK